MSTPRSSNPRGFTLIEVLVALAIVSIALLAAMRTAGMGTNNADALRSRLLASWVAADLIAERQARGDWPPLGIRRGSARQAGRNFAWREEVITTPNAAFRRIDVFVFEGAESSASLARLTSFAPLPPRTGP